MPPDQYTFGLLTQQQLEEAWPQIRTLLAKAEHYTRGEITADDILLMTRENRASVFVLLAADGIKSAMAVTFSSHPRGKSMNIALFGGIDTKMIFMRFGHIVMQFAKECGASRITAYCRPSAARLFNFITGSREIYRVISKDI